MTDLLLHGVENEEREGSEAERRVKEWKERIGFRGDVLAIKVNTDP